MLTRLTESFRREPELATITTSIFFDRSAHGTGAVVCPRAPMFGTLFPSMSQQPLKSPRTVSTGKWTGLGTSRVELLGKIIEHHFRLNDVTVRVNHAHCYFLLCLPLD